MIQSRALDRNGSGYPEDDIIQGSSMLPFRQNTFSVQRAKLSVAQPYRGEVCAGGANARRHFNADNSVFAAVALGALDAEFVKAFEIVIVNGWNCSALFRRLDKFPE